MNTAKIIVGILHILISITMIALILLQTGKKAGMGGVMGGAADTFYSKNKTRTMDAILARFTKVCAIGFLITSLFLAYGDTFVSTPDAVNDETPISVPSDIDESEIPVQEGEVQSTEESVPAQSPDAN